MLLPLTLPLEAKTTVNLGPTPKYHQDPVSHAGTLAVGNAARSGVRPKALIG